MMKHFTITKRQEEHIAILEINGELDAHTAFQLEQQFKTLIETEAYHIIVNCSNLEYIASAGLGVFMAYIEDIRNLGGDIKLSNMTDGVYHVFDLLGFPSLYDIHRDESDALNSFKPKSSPVQYLESFTSHSIMYPPLLSICEKCATLFKILSNNLM